MGHDNLKIEFNPDKELLDFAEFFSKNWKILVLDKYNSYHNNYMINYVDDINNPFDTVVRIGQTTKIIEISKHGLTSCDANENFIFYIILWCIVDFELKNTFNSDKTTLTYYLKTKRSIKDLMTCIIKSFTQRPNLTDSKRTIDMFKLIDSWKK